MRKTVVLLAVGFLAAGAFGYSLQISLGVREVDPNLIAGKNPGDFNNDTNPGGGIEWFSLDQQTLTLDGTWQKFTFNIDPTTISPITFTGDGLITRDKGILEHIRVKFVDTRIITLWTDEVYHSWDPSGIPPPTGKLISTFAADPNGAPWANGTEVMFQEPGFSGSTAAYLEPNNPAVNFSGIDNTTGHDDSSSVRARFNWKDYNPNNWLRYTAYAAVPRNERNPILAEAGGPLNTYASSTLTFWMKGTPEPSSLLLLGLGGVAALRRRR